MSNEKKRSPRRRGSTAKPASGTYPRSATQVLADITRRHDRPLTVDEAAEEVTKQQAAYEELSAMPSSSGRENEALLSSLPILAVAFGRKSGITVNIGGRVACTDGKSIQLPALPLNAPRVLHALTLGYLYHETGHIEVTNIRCFNEAANESPLIRNLLNVFEDIRMEAWRNQRYAGSGGVLAMTAALVAADAGFGKAEDVKKADPAETLCTALITGLRSTEIGQPVEAIARLWRERLLEVFGKAVVMKLDALCTGAATLVDTAQALRLARKVAAMIEEEAAASKGTSGTGFDPNDAPSDADEGSDHGEPAEGSKDAGEAEGDAPGDQSGQGSSADADGGADHAPTSTTTPEQGKALQAVLEAGEGDYPKTDLGDILGPKVQAAANAAVAEEAKAQGGCGAGSMSTMRERLAHKSGHTELDLVASASSRLRVKLASRLQADAREKRVYVEQGNRMDGRVLHRLFLGDGRLFVRKEVRKSVDTALQIVLDRSGSMTGGGIQLARQATLAVALGLEQIPRVKTAALAFPEVEIMKPWDESAKRAAGRFVMEAEGSTPMAQAMLHAAASLASRRESRKILVVITDGMPDNPISVKALVSRLKRARVECIGVGIQCDAVAALFPRWVSVSSLDELSTKLFNLMGHQLSQRRVA